MENERSPSMNMYKALLEVTTVKSNIPTANCQFPSNPPNSAPPNSARRQLLKIPPNVQPAICNLFEPPREAERSQLGSETADYVSKEEKDSPSDAVPPVISSTTSDGVRLFLDQSQGERDISFDKEQQEEAAMSHLLTIAPDRIIGKLLGGRLAAAVSGQSNDVFIATVSHDGRLDITVANSSVEKEKEEGRCSTLGKTLPSSRVALCGQGSEGNLFLFYQQQPDGAIVRRTWNVRHKGWTDPRIFVPAEECISGSCLAALQLSSTDVVLYWQDKTGLLRYWQGGDIDSRKTTDLKLPERAIFRTYVDSSKERVDLYWIDENPTGATIRKATSSIKDFAPDGQKGPAKWIILPANRDWHSQNPLADFSVMQLPNTDAVMFYALDRDGVCSEWDDCGDWFKLRETDSGNALLSSFGLAIATYTSEGTTKTVSPLSLYVTSAGKGDVLTTDLLRIDSDPEGSCMKWSSEKRIASMHSGDPPLQTENDSTKPTGGSSIPPSTIPKASGVDGTTGDSQPTVGGDTLPQKKTEGNGSLGQKGAEDKLENGASMPDPMPLLPAHMIPDWIKKTCVDVVLPGLKTTATSAAKDLAQRALDRVRADTDSTKEGKHQLHAVVASRDKLWMGAPQRIPYFFLDGTDLQKAKVRKVCQEWTWYAYVEFVEATSAENSQVRIRFNPKKGSWSYVGLDCDTIRDPSAETMNLAWIDRFSDLTRTERAVILHEFGHVLGLLHEHQSPAHGGTAVKNVQAALQIYESSQGWTEQEVYDQVINVYKDVDVSNYSRVDTQSIMHYPQPKELTGLAQDIGYNLELSDLDKAYMVLQYPRKSPSPQAPTWTLSHALDVMGCPVETANQVLALAQSAEPASALTKIRTLIDDWATAVHDEKRHNSSISNADGQAISGSAPLIGHAVNIDPPKSESMAVELSALLTKYGTDGALEVQAPLEDICATTAMIDDPSYPKGEDHEKATSTGISKPAHAVFSVINLIGLPSNNTDERVKITYGYSSQCTPTLWQKWMVEKGTQVWQNFASVSFQMVKEGDTPDLLIFISPDETVLPDSKIRSKCLMYPTSSLAVRKKMRVEVVKANKGLVKGVECDIAYHGIFKEEPQAKKYTSSKIQSKTSIPLDGIMLNMRSIIHELGHYLGLDHEYCGIYGSWIRKEKDQDMRLNATKYAIGSVMDVIGVEVNVPLQQVLVTAGVKKEDVRELILKNEIPNELGLTQFNVVPTLYDEANIALLYPGVSNLVERVKTTSTGKPPYQLQLLGMTSSTSKLEYYLSLLSVASDAQSLRAAVNSIQTPLEMGKWTEARDAYVALLTNQVAHYTTMEASLQSIEASKITVIPPKQPSLLPTLTTTSGSGSKRPRDGLKDGGTEPDAKHLALPDKQGKPGGKGGNAAGTSTGANSSDKPKGGGPLRDVGNMPGITPLHAADDGTGAASETNAAPDKVEGPFIQVLYDKIKNYFPPGNGQYFALQFPTRFLDKNTYAYNTADSFARFEKPVSVNEAEFRLTDELFPVGPIVGGPNGQSLVSNYVKALNSLTPSYDGSMARKQREKMRMWLLTQTNPGDAAWTVDTRLGVPGLPADAASALSSSSGIAVRPSRDFSFNGDGNSAAGKGGIKPSASVNSNQMTAIKANAMRALEGVESTDSLKPRPMTRMEFCDSLMMDYLEESERWETEKDALIAKAEGASETDPKAMNQLMRNLVHIQGQKYAKISAKYADAVVRGHLHTVHELLGHLDVKTLAELLQDAKDSLRNSAMSSLYTASSIYPVQMMPADWFMGLDTGFTREDLSQDPDMVKAAIQAKSMTIDSLQNQIATLRGFFKGDPKQFKDAMNEMAEERDKALGDLTSKYAESTISGVKLILTEVASATPVGQVAAAASEAASLASAGLNSIKNGTDEAQKSRLKGLLGENFEKLDDIGKQMDAVDKANVKVNAKSRELTEKMGDFALAMAGDTRTEVENLQRKLTAAKAELEDLHQSYLIAMQAKTKRTGATPPSLEKDGQLPSSTPGGGGTRWFDISLNTEVTESASASSSSQSSSNSAWNCSFWIGSYSSSTSKNDAQTASTESASSLKIDISMRVTYVTVDRSGWFDPSFMEVSGSFMHSSPDGVYTPWSKWPTSTAPTNSEDGAIPTPLSAKEVVQKIVQNRMVPNAPELVPGYLVAYPIGYILVKDCVLKLSNHRNSNTFDKKHFDEQSQSSGGILCFSHSSGSGSSKDTSSSSSLQTSDGLVIRIPGPQILGYMMQLMPQDASKKFEAMPSDYLFDGDVDPSSRKAASGGENPIAEHSINISSDPAAGSARPKPASGVREYKVAESNLTNGAAVGKSEPIVTAAHSVNMTQPVPQAAAAAKEGGANSNVNAKAAQSFVDAIKDALTSNDAFFKQRPASTQAEILRKIEDLKLVFDPDQARPSS